jgi:glycosyltransferase involved in cell wall biosynthesis
MRVGVFLDYRFRRVGNVITTERAFALFVFALAGRLSGLTLVGRLDPATEPFPYEAPATVRLVPLPYYESLTRPLSAAVALLRGTVRLWRALDELDVIWVLGPNPLAVVLAVLGRLRRRRVVLGVRQDTRSYVRSRHPGRRGMALAGAALDASFRLVSRWCPVVAVGDQIAESYGRAPQLHRLVVSLVSEADIVSGDGAAPAATGQGARIISVGRLDAEKNPLLMADILAGLVAAAPDVAWHLDVYGDGPLAGALAGRLAELDVGARATLHGYVAADAGLWAAYREADILLHVSWTEGVPQVLLEAFAARLPVVATAVGGVAALVGDAALLVEPGDADAAVAALVAVAADDDLRRRLLDAGTAVVRERTLEREVDGLATFLAGAAA